MAPKSNIIRRLKAKYSVKIKGRRKRSVSLFCKTFAPALSASNDSPSLPLNTSELNRSSASYSGYNDSSTIDKSSTSTGLKILQKEVRAIFNEKYSEAVKKNNQRLPYSRVDELGISMLGLPLEVFFKKPSRVWCTHMQRDYQL
ncbi:unnamed protein product [Clavelina lepadiformis]|uniref:Uncharacterized protein n=1 Tax=Clavelina lepadiformis TaxID=159417 RepID=A0ABP0GM17_CLALP